MAAYFPYRAFKTRPYFKEFLELPEKDRRWDVLTQIALFSTGRTFGEDSRSNPVAHTCQMNESWLASAVAEFFNQGQVVFHIAPKLREAFQQSDLGEATAADLRFPFNDFYVHLGRDLGLSFNDGATVLEGVFLHHSTDRDGKDNIRITMVGELVAPPAHWGERGLESFSTYIGVEEMALPLEAALRHHLEREARDPLEDPELRDLSQFNEKERNDILEGWKRDQHERKLTAKNVEVVLECMRLCANALLYISQYPDDVAEEWQDGAPRGHVEKVARTDSKQRDKALSRARSDGFTLIRKVGNLFEHEELGGSGNSPAPHLRRAHWRRQSHGPRGALRKLIWIRATRVLGGDTRERPYLVAATETLASPISPATPVA